MKALGTSLLLAVMAVGANSQGIWRDDFLLPTLDSYRWQVTTNGATAETVGGVLRLTPTSNSVPYVVSQELPFGIGDWTLEIKFRYATDGNTLPIDVEGLDLVGEDPLHPTRCFQIYQDGNIKVSMQGTTVYAGPAPDHNYHVARLMCSAGKYTCWLDDVQLAQQTAVYSAEAISIGYPGPISNVTFPEFDVDYVSVVTDSLRQPFSATFQTGNVGSDNRDTVWTVQGPNVPLQQAYIIAPHPSWRNLAGTLWLCHAPTWQDSSQNGVFNYNAVFSPPDHTHILGLGSWLSDDAPSQVVLNGTVVASGGGFDHYNPFRIDETVLANGPNVMSANITNSGGPEGFTLRFDMFYLPADDAPTALHVADVSSSCGAPLNLTATLVDTTSGLPIADRQIDFFLGPVWVGHCPTGQDGVASVTVDTSVLPESVTTWTALYRSTDSYAGAIATAAATFQATPSVVTAYDAGGVVGIGTTLMARLHFTDQGHILSGQELVFHVGSRIAGIGFTDSTGLATIDFKPLGPDYPSATITVDYAGAACVLPASGTATLTVDATGSGITLMPQTGYPGTAMNIKATLYRMDDQAPLQGETIDFSFNGSSIGSATTDASGNAALAFTVPEGYLDGIVPLVANFAGDGGDLPIEASADFTVMQVRPIHGTITLANFAASPAGLPIDLVMRTIDTGALVASGTAQLDANGAYAWQVQYTGKCSINAHVSHWLRSTVSPVTIYGVRGATANFSLTNGDADESNRIGIGDLSVVLANFDNPGGDGDLDGSELVDLGDLSIVLQSFGKSGDP